MWYEQFTFWDRNPGLPEPVAADYFSRPFSEAEFTGFPAIDSLYPPGRTAAAFPVPPQLKLPLDYQELLAYSNGEREFSYFEPEDIRGFYIRYGFPVWAPALLPIGLNGGGIFYAYDFRAPGAPPIVAVAAGNIDYDSTAVLGENLADMLRADTNIGNAL